MSSARSVAALDPGGPSSSSCASGWPRWSADPPAIPSRPCPGLADLVPLHAGATYAVDSASLALALAAGASQAGEWVGFAGCADFGVEAAAELGIELSRTVLVPDPASTGSRSPRPWSTCSGWWSCARRPPSTSGPQDPRLPAAHGLRGAGRPRPVAARVRPG